MEPASERERQELGGGDIAGGDRVEGTMPTKGICSRTLRSRSIREGWCGARTRAWVAVAGGPGGSYCGGEKGFGSSGCHGREQRDY